MKKKFVLIMLMAVTCLASAQTEGNVKLYGYKEPVIKGNSPQVTIDESGKQTSDEKTQGFNYLIYLVSPARVYVSEMWINGHPYAASLETIASPVVKKNHNNPSSTESRELVPKTKGILIWLKPVPAVKEKLTEKGRTLAAGNELVVVYKQNGKFYYNTVASLIVLEAAVMQ